MTELEILKKENNELKQEIEKAKKVLKIFEHEKNVALQIQLNVIALKLQPEYQDFMSIADEDDNTMTIELGINLKWQLKNIFSILKKQGVNFK